MAITVEFLSKHILFIPNNYLTLMRTFFYMQFQLVLLINQTYFHYNLYKKACIRIFKLLVYDCKLYKYLISNSSPDIADNLINSGATGPLAI